MKFTTKIEYLRDFGLMKIFTLFVKMKGVVTITP